MHMCAYRVQHVCVSKMCVFELGTCVGIVLVH